MTTFADIVKAKKKVKMKIVGTDGNAYSLMGAFHAKAFRNGWTADEIKAVLDECTSGNYDHLLSTLIAVTK